MKTACVIALLFIQLLGFAQQKLAITASNLKYEIVNKGSGSKPLVTDKVTFNYIGTLEDGTVFDDSYKRGQPIEVLPTNMIKGLTEGLQLMPLGAKYIFYIPANLAYGDRGAGQIKPNANLIFEVELIKINDKEAKDDIARTDPVNPKAIYTTIKTKYDTYTGYVVDGKKEGKGKFEDMLFGITYDGDWKNDKRDGKGVEEKKDSWKYQGSFKDNEMNGEGIIYYSNGDYTKGKWANNKLEGEATMFIKMTNETKKVKYINGEMIATKNATNKKPIYTSFKMKNGSDYEGYAIDDQPEGQGQETDFLGGVYKGEWKNGKRDGVGKYTYSNGNAYEGQWKNGKKEGKGKQINTVSTLTGTWINGQLEGQVIKYDLFSNTTKTVLYKDDLEVLK